MSSDVVKLQCRRESLEALAVEFARFGPVEGEPSWLVPAVWLCTHDRDFLASSSTKVMSDGFIARPLAIDCVDDFEQRLQEEVPDISARLVGRGADSTLPEARGPAPATNLDMRPAGAYSLRIIIRVSERSATVHRVACGLLFDFERDSSLLVGTDMGTLAMVISEDRELIDRYVAACEAVDAEEYLATFC